VDKLGKYEIVDKIGVGGFGVVFKGYDPFIKRHVAIKTCSAGDRETRDRFLREAEIAGNLQHRNIVTVFEFGFQEETPYLVQEFLTGEDLDHKIRRRDALPLADKIAWLTEVARGLEFAHQRGVVHRDIKPGNIRIQQDNIAKILDFGIAKLAQQQSNLTQVGVTLGTASYLAPEQIRGESVDGRTDVFSFGVLAYELLTYERPFRAQEISALFFKLLNEKPPPLSSKAPGIPAALEQIVLCCLEKDPAKRWSPTAELVRALERLERRPGVDAAPVGASDDEDATRVHEAQTLTFAPTQATRVPAPQPPAPAARGKAPALGDLELDTPRSGAIVETEGMSATGLGGNRKLRVALVAGLAAVALGVAVVFLGLPRGTASDAVREDPAAKAAPAPASKSSASAPRSETAPPQLPVAEARAPAPAVEKPAPAPEPPKRGRLIVGPAWDPGMMLTVGGRRYRLDREQTIELPAGTLSLEFSLESPSYSTERDLRLKLGSGATERVSIPIERPGRLTVQPHLNTRGGTVRIDGNIVGPTPLRGRWLAPGEHFVEIFPLGAGVEPGFSRPITIASAVETVVTVDLDRKLEPTIRERKLESP